MEDKTAEKTDEPKMAAQVVKFTGLPTGEGLAVAVGSNAVEIDDEFQNFYIGAKASKDIIIPPYSPKQLRNLCHTNNALQPCIDAMSTNVDGTGFEFIRDDLKPEDQDKDPEIKKLWDFFLEPWPGQDFISMRKKLREDKHQTGNAYLEVIENAQGEIMFLRPMEATMTRLVKLDEPYITTKVLQRRGRNISVQVSVRERRFAQIIGTQKVVYFKEFGAGRDLDKWTGEWAPPGQRLPFKRRASSVFHFKDLDDVNTAYGVPRWVTQMPSVLGSRQAEEFNLEYFSAGGIPPVMLILQGGVLANVTREAITQFNEEPAKRKHRMMAIEAEPTGGGMDSPGTARVTVERFGSERQNDSMFENYDAKCEARIRRAFRLPPIFVGGAGDYSFATAYTSYTVAEAQIFRPEREAFDEIISNMLIPALGISKEYRMRSLGLKIEDATIRLKGIQMAHEIGHAESSDLIREINETTGIHLKHTDQWQDPKGQLKLEKAKGQDPSSTEVPNGTLSDKTGLPAGIDNPVNVQ